MDCAVVHEDGTPGCTAYSLWLDTCRQNLDQEWSVCDVALLA